MEEVTHTTSRNHGHIHRQYNATMIHGRGTVQGLEPIFPNDFAADSRCSFGLPASSVAASGHMRRSIWFIHEQSCCPEHGKAGPKSKLSPMASERADVKFDSSRAAGDGHRDDHGLRYLQNFSDPFQFLNFLQVNGTRYLGKRQLKLEFYCGCTD